MKIIAILFSSVIIVIALNSCVSKADAKGILENAQTRTEIFNAIANNHDFMSEFMKVMQNNNHVMQMMQGDKMMINTMRGGNGMYMMMKDSMMTKNYMRGMMANPEMMQLMMGEMMKDSKTMNTMLQMMQQGGIMSKDCMQSSMKMMGGKEMRMMNNSK